MQPSVVKVPLIFGDAMAALSQITSSPEHHLWQQNTSISDLRVDIQARIQGHNQLADAVLLDLALRNNGRLATFDRRLAALIPPQSPLQAALTVIPA